MNMGVVYLINKIFSRELIYIVNSLISWRFSLLISSIYHIASRVKFFIDFTDF